MIRRNKFKRSPWTQKWLKTKPSVLNMRKVEKGQEKAKNRIRWVEATEKFVHNIFLLILIFTLLYQIHSCISEFIRGPTYTETRLVQQNKALFPAMTICPKADGYKLDMLKVTS